MCWAARGFGGARSTPQLAVCTPQLLPRLGQQMEMLCLQWLLQFFCGISARLCLELVSSCSFWRPGPSHTRISYANLRACPHAEGCGELGEQQPHSSTIHLFCLSAAMASSPCWDHGVEWPSRPRASSRLLAAFFPWIPCHHLVNQPTGAGLPWFRPCQSPESGVEERKYHRL